jgi:hypothetical protein
MHAEVASVRVLVESVELLCITVTTSNDMKRVNVQVPDEIHTRAKVIAVLKGVTLNEDLEAAIRQTVEHDQGVFENLKRK